MTTTFLTADDISRNVPNGPDTFQPEAVKPCPTIRNHSLIKEKLTQLRRIFKVTTSGYTVPVKSNWTYGITTDGIVMGERWKYDREGIWCVIDEKYFTSVDELHTWCTNLLRLHWFEPKVIPSRFDK